MKKKLTIRTFWEVRYFPKTPAMAHSQGVGYKGRLLPFRQACAVIARLKRSGVEALRYPYRIASGG